MGLSSASKLVGQVAWEPSPTLAGIGVLFASICFGVVPYFSRGLIEAGLAPHAVAFYCYVLTGALLIPVLIRNRHVWREILWGIGAGAIMGLGWIGYVAALEVAPVSTVGVLYMTYPVFTVVIAWLLFQDRPTKRAIFAALLVVLAAIVAGAPQALSSEHALALLLALGAPFGFGVGISVLVHRLSRIPALARLASVCLGSCFGLFPLVITSHSGEILPATPGDWVLVVGIGLLTALVPQLIYSVCSPVIGASRTAIMGSVELPTMFVLGVFAFGQPLTLEQGIACFLILAAVFATGSRKTRNVSTTLNRT